MCTASGARWRTGSRSSNWTCSPTGPVATVPGQPVPGAARRGGLRVGAGVAADGVLGRSWRAQVGTIRLKLFKVAARVVALPATEWATAQVGTIRWKLLKAAAGGSDGAAGGLPLASGYPFQSQFRVILERVLRMAMPGRAGVG